MTQSIWKYPMSIDLPDSVVNMPAGAKVLTVQMQQGKPTMWVLLWPDAPRTPRAFSIVGTGHDLDDTRRDYLGTVQDGGFVWHVFEVLA